MGRVLPRENSWVEAVPCRMLTQSTGSRCGVAGGLGLFDVCSASVNTVLTAARPDVLRNVRLVGPFALPFDMVRGDAFPEVMQTSGYSDCALAKNLTPTPEPKTEVGEIKAAIV